MSLPTIDVFLATPTLENFHKLITANPQELNNLDFKTVWIDFDKVAKHLLAIANSGGGVIVFGVQQSGPGVYTPVGLDKLKDKIEIFKKTKPYLPTTLDYSLLDFHFDAEYADTALKGKSFQTVVVIDRPNYMPFVSTAEGTNIRRNAIYIRKGTGSTEATYEDLQSIINRRIETAYSTRSDLDLEHHLAELKILYRYLYQFDTMFSYDNYPGHGNDMLSDLEIQGNQFIRELIETKEEVIRKRIGLQE